MRLANCGNSDPTICQAITCDAQTEQSRFLKMHFSCTNSASHHGRVDNSLMLNRYRSESFYSCNKSCAHHRFLGLEITFSAGSHLDSSFSADSELSLAVDHFSKSNFMNLVNRFRRIGKLYHSNSSRSFHFSELEYFFSHSACNIFKLLDSIFSFNFQSFLNLLNSFLVL